MGISVNIWTLLVAFLYKLLPLLNTKWQDNKSHLEKSIAAAIDELQELEAAFAKQELHPGDLKLSVEKYLNGLLEPVRKTFESPELKKLVSSAYPPPVKVKPGQQAQVSPLAPKFPTSSKILNFTAAYRLII